MAKTSVRTRVLVPLLAIVFAFAFAPAAFAAPQGNANLESMALQIQEEEGEVVSGNNGIGEALNNTNLIIDNPIQVYSGKELRPTFRVVDKTTGKIYTGSDNFQDPTADYFYFYMNNVEVGDNSKPEDDRPQVVVATFSDEDPYVFIKQGFFTIKPFDVKNTNVSVANQTYTGKQLKPGVSVTYGGMTLRNGVDYTVSYGKNVKVGNGTVKITGKGNYAGTKTATFKIKKATIADAKFSKVKDQVYNGKSFKPNVKVKYKGKLLKKNKDYTISYGKNKKAGTGKVIIKGKKNLKGKHVIYFVIEPAPIGKCSLSHGGSYTWTGSAIYPWTTLKYKGMTLKNGRDYNLIYSHNVEPNGMATPTVRINAKGNYSGSRTYTFTINKRDIATVTAYTPYSEYNYTGSDIKPYPTVTYNGRTLTSADYWLEYPSANYWDAGTKQIIIHGQGNHFYGVKYVYYKIVNKPKPPQQQN